MRPRSVRATAEERRRAFPGDGLLDEAIRTWTHGVTVAAPPQEVWPWLAQMGAGRAGWYSWDLLDNEGHPSADELVAGWERLAVGDVLPAERGAKDAFVVERLEPGRDLVLAVPHGSGGLRSTWEFLLEPLPGERTRLLVRARVSARGWMEPLGSPTPRAARVQRALARLPRGPLLALARAVHRLMQARQLRGIRRRAEAWRPRRSDARARGGELRAREGPAAGEGSAAAPRIAGAGRNVVGQGGRIMLFAAPAAAAAVAAHLLAPDLVRIPIARSVLGPLGVALVVVGLACWLTAMVQLLRAFARGRLVTSGAYRACRHPVYASFGLLVLPGLSLATGTWGYLVVAAALCLGVRIFVGEEEEELRREFGDAYRRYAARVHPMVPFARPGRGGR